MTIAEIWRVAEASVSSDALFGDVDAIWRHDRWFSYNHFGKSCAYCVERMAEAGLAETEEIHFPADGKTVYGDIPMPLAWDAEDAQLHIVEPEGADTLIASYRETPASLLMYSNSTPPEGVEAEVVHIENGGDPAEYEKRPVRGKVVFTGAPPAEVIPLATAHGAAGIVSDYMRLVDGVSDRETQKDAVGWINDGFSTLGTRGRDDLDIFGFLLSPEMGDRLRVRLSEGPQLRLKAQVSTRLYEGDLNVATGLVPGVNRDEEILLSGHLYEPGAGDNASGVAAMIEAGRTLVRLIGEGKLPQPKRSIRFVFGQEFIGLGAYLHKKRYHLKNIVGGLNLDDIGHKPASRSRLSVHGAHDACPSFLTYLAEDLASRMKALIPDLCLATGAGFEQYDNHGCDPMVGAPTPVLGASKKAYYHTSLDTPDTLDPDSLAAHATLAATYSYTLASTGLTEATELAQLGIGPARLRLEQRIDRRMAKAHETGARHLTEALAFYRDVEVGGLRALQALVPMEEQAAFDERTTQHVRLLNDLTDAKLREASGLQAPPLADGAPVEADQLAPKRKTFGLLTFENLPGEVRREQQSDNDLRMGAWGSAQDTLYWCDGKRTVRDVAMMIGHSTGRYDVEATLKRLRFLEEHSFIVLLKRIGREALARQIRAMGVAEGDTLWIHSSLSSLGSVDGGPRTVVEALLDVLGPEGTLVMPCFYQSFVSRDDSKPPFNRDTSPAMVGAITEAFRTWPGVVRSESPTHSVAALGPLKESLTARHKNVTPYAKSGPFGRIYDLDAKILFLGCGLKPNSFLHAFEDWKDLPYLTTEEVRVTDGHGNGELVTVAKVPMGHRDFYCGNDSKIARRMLEAGLFKCGKVGMSECLLTTAQAMGDFVLSLLDQDPRILLCDDSGCEFCRQYA